MRYRILLLWLCGAWALDGQTPSYLHYGVADGLPSNLVYTGLQDRNGLLWFGTDKGLARFDGQRFHVYTRADGLPDPEVLDMNEDSRGRLWLSCFRPETSYLSNGKIITGREDSTLHRVKGIFGINHVFNDRDGTIWLSTGGQEVYAAKGQNLVPYPEGVFHIFRMSRLDSMLVAMTSLGILRAMPDSSFSLIYDLRQDVGERPDFKSGDFSGNRVLFSLVDKLVLLEYRDGAFRLLDVVDHEAGRVFADSRGTFWVCSPTGAFAFDPDQADLKHPRRYLPDQKVNWGFEDQQGTLWFCTRSGGVFGLPRFAPQTFGRTEGLVSTNITALARSAAGTVLAGDDEGRVHSLLPDGWQTVRCARKEGENLVRQILPAQAGGFWVTTSQGIYWSDGRSATALRPRKGANPKWIALQSKKLWVAAGGLLGYFLAPDDTLYTVIKSRFTVVAVDDEQIVWAGNMNGLHSEADRFKSDWGDVFPLLKSRIVAIHPAGAGRLWVVTPEAGLLKLTVQAGRVLEVQAVNDWIVPQHIQNIQTLFVEPGPDGRVWMGTNHGVFGLKSDSSVVRFTTHDGLVDDDVRALLVCGDTLWAGSAAGLSRLLLRPLDATDFRTLVSGLRYQEADSTVFFNLVDSIQTGITYVLPSGTSLLELELAGLDYLSRGNLRFECVMTELLPPLRWWTFSNLITWIGNGFRGKRETSWIENGKMSFGVELPPGRYHLRIAAESNRNVRSRTPAELSLILMPYWYETLWFILLLWAAGGVLLWRAVKARSAYRELNSAVSELQLQALQAQINPHFIGNSINAIQQFFYPPDPVKASEYIELFTRLLRRTMASSERNVVTFQEELEYNTDYLRMILLRFGQRFEYRIEGTEAVPPDTPFPTMLLQPILENATVHGMAIDGVSVLLLRFSWDGARLMCTVTDNGPGIKATMARKKASGSDRVSKGLELIHYKVHTLNRLMGGQLDLRVHDRSDLQTDRHGTEVVLSFYPKKLDPAGLVKPSGPALFKKPLPNQPLPS